jgi:hypothetical protein
VRDARILPIYEGTNGVQALDLVGRKLPKDGGRAVMAFFAEVGDFLRDHDGPELAAFVRPTRKGLDDLRAATMWFMANAMTNPDNAGAGATDYMHLFGLVALGYMWGRMAAAAAPLIAAGDPRAVRLAADLAVGRAYVERALPETALRLARITAGSEAVMAIPAAAF